jgi:hypothetical protein
MSKAVTFEEWLEWELYRQSEVNGLDIQRSVNPLEIVIDLEEEILHYFNTNLQGLKIK